MAQVGMLNEHRKILRENYFTIAKEMQADRVLQSMKDIFTAFDEEEIRAERTESKRAEKMLDMLPRKGENAFRKFLVALWQIQPWLAEHLAQLAGIEVSELTQRTTRLGMKDVHREILRKHVCVLSDKLDIQRMVPRLVEVGVFDDNVAHHILKQGERRCQVEKLILDVLPKCGPDAFENFYSCLKSLQPALAHDFNELTKKSHPDVVLDETTCYQESDKNASSNEVMTSSLEASSSSYSLSSPCSGLPEEVYKVLENVLDGPPDELYNNDWQMLYKELRLPTGKEELIRRKEGSPTRHVIRSWIKAKGKDATVQHLLSVLKKCYHGDLVSKIEKILGVEYEEVGEMVGTDLVDNMANLNIKPVRLIGNIPQNLKKYFVEHLNDLGVEVLSKMATNITERRCYVHNASDFLEKIKTYKMRILFRELRKEEQHVMVQWMRNKFPAGSTGPLVLDDESRANEMPYLRRCEITKVLTANGEWQIVAGHVGLKINDIKILERRGKDPAEDVLSYWEVRSGTTVGALYDVLVDCELCSVADML